MSPARCSRYNQPLSSQNFTPMECRKDDVLCSEKTFICLKMSNITIFMTTIMLVGWLVGWWLAGWLVGWLVGWIIFRSDG